MTAVVMDEEVFLIDTIVSFLHFVAGNQKWDTARLVTETEPLNLWVITKVDTPPSQLNIPLLGYEIWKSWNL